MYPRKTRHEKIKKNNCKRFSFKTGVLNEKCVIIQENFEDAS